MLGLLWGNRNNYSWLVGVPTPLVTMEIIISIIIFIFILEIFILPWLSGSISTTSISYFALICILAFTDVCNLSLSIYCLIRVQLSHGTSSSSYASQIEQIFSMLHHWLVGMVLLLTVSCINVDFSVRDFVRMAGIKQRRSIQS